MRRRRLGLLVVPLLALALGPLAAGGPRALADPGVRTAAPTTATTAVPVPTDSLDWGRCADSYLRSIGARCTSLAVPLDPDQPDGRTITLALSRVRHTSPAADYQGAIVLNPGGPGGSGLTMSGLSQRLPASVASTYDWIGFDPRGIGASRPLLRCDRDMFGYGRPAYQPSAARIRAWKQRDRAYAATCAREHPDLLAHDTTADTAHDVDRIREALGLDQITWFGYSYGTYIGQVYGTLFPDRVRRMVLDSNVDPRSVWYRSTYGQARAMEPNLNAFFGWIARHHRVYDLGSTRQQVRRAWVAQRDRLTRHPVGGRRSVGGAEWTDSFLYAVYSSSLWPFFAGTFSRWVHQHDLARLRYQFEAFNGVGDDNSFAGYLAVSCSEGTYPRSFDTWASDTTAAARRSPLLAWPLTWFQEPCRTWAVHDSPLVDIDLSGVSSGLLIDQVHDAATPFEGSLEVRSRFPGARLLKITGDRAVDHAASLSGDACVDGRIAAYLRDGSLPARAEIGRAHV